MGADVKGYHGGGIDKTWQVFCYGEDGESGMTEVLNFSDWEDGGVLNRNRTVLRRDDLRKRRSYVLGILNRICSEQNARLGSRKSWVHILLQTQPCDFGRIMADFQGPSQV